jgi:hypothetical protein
MSFCNKLQSKTDFDDEIAFFEETMENVSGIITNKTMFLKFNDDILQNYNRVIEEKNKIIENLQMINKQNIIFIEFVLKELLNKELNYGNFVGLEEMAKQHDKIVDECDKQINTCEDVLDGLQKELDVLVK